MSLCMSCMSHIGENTVCPVCGFDNNSQQKAPYLPFKTLLNNRYIVGKVTDVNGESACYIGLDKVSDSIVRIREFLPFSIFERDENEKEVKVTIGNKNIYDGLFNEFVMYYRILAGMKGLSANVEILDIFPENNTCYVIEEDEELITFSEYVTRSGGKLDWDIARPLLMPVISLLEAMHSNGIGHYALSPENICVTPAGKLKLLRCSTENVRRRGTLLKVSLISGISAPEQYNVHDVIDEQTDVYGFTALLFYALSGVLPPNAEKRNIDKKLFMSSAVAKRLPPHVLSALVKGLNVDRNNRVKTFDELRSMLSAESTVEAMREKISRTSMMKSVGKEKVERQRKSRVPVFLISFIITALVIVTAITALYSSGFFDNHETVPKTPAVTESPSSTDWTGPTVSNYVGMSYEEAQRSLENTGIELVKSYNTVYSDVYEKGVIVSQQPEAGTPIRSSDGSAVIYVEVSNGTQMRQLPDISNYTIEAAASVLGDAGFVASEILEYSDTVPAGCVIGYDGYKAGDRLQAGSTVIIRVSRGSAPADAANGIDTNGTI